MISKNLIKHINSLKLAKFREKHNCFIAEGPKLVEEFLRSNFTVEKIICTQDWHDQFTNIINDKIEINIANENDLKRISNLSTPNKVLAIIQKPESKLSLESIDENLLLILDDIRNPGNLGTIIRLADWYGLNNIYCSNETVDVYNPKVIQSSMGSLCRVKINYIDLSELLSALKGKYKIFGSDMNAKNIYQEELPEKSAIIIGNEANGISNEIFSLVDERISIPTFRKGAESLNASVATAILVSEYFRNNF